MAVSDIIDVLLNIPFSVCPDGTMSQRHVSESALQYHHQAKSFQRLSAYLPKHQKLTSQGRQWANMWQLGKGCAA